MKVLKPDFDLNSFWHQVKQANQRILFFDYDGTLAPFRVQRDLAFPYDGIREILSDMINAGHSRLVLVSGRGIGDLQQLLGLRQPIEIWGAHGLERLHVDGNYEVGKLDEAAASGLLQARQHVENFAPASQYESKPGSLALHWRGLAQPKIKEIQGALAGHWIEIAQRANLILTEFDGGMELRVSGVNKGSAVRTVLNEMKDDAAAAFLGDDVTDEDAFAALSGKGAGILVREELRPTAADLWLKPPEELMQFLENWHKISGGV